MIAVVLLQTNYSRLAFSIQHSAFSPLHRGLKGLQHRRRGQVIGLQHL